MFMIRTAMILITYRKTFTQEMRTPGINGESEMEEAGTGARGAPIDHFSLMHITPVIS